METITNFSVKEFKNEFRLMCSDTWGCALDAWFEATGQMCTRWIDIPNEWQYKAGLSPLEPDNYFHELFNNCTDEEIISIANFLYRYCQYLKFKGSEFYNDPEYCAKWIRENRQENENALKGIIVKLKEQLSALVVENEKLNRSIDGLLETGSSKLSQHQIKSLEQRNNALVSALESIKKLAASGTWRETIDGMDSVLSDINDKAKEALTNNK